ncbi:MAG: hypothetical protein LBT86_03835 [Deltaproteobacteria bacterium]|jgi:hypothetical protein|nr:hypothetical protein [Deltaproteobacteria bacterium]
MSEDPKKLTKKKKTSSESEADQANEADRAFWAEEYSLGLKNLEILAQWGEEEQEDPHQSDDLWAEAWEGIEEPEEPPDLPVLRGLKRVIEELLAEDEPVFLWSAETNQRMLLAMERLGLPIRLEDLATWLERLGFVRIDEEKQEKYRLAKIETLNRQIPYILDLIQVTKRKRHPVLAIVTKKIPPPASLIAALGSDRAKDPENYYYADANWDKFVDRGLYELGYRERERLFTLDTDIEEAVFALSSIQGWWLEEGQRLFRFPESMLLVVTGGLTTGYGGEMWRTSLQELANVTDLRLHVSHGPEDAPWLAKNAPGKELFSFYSSNWGGWEPCCFQTTVKILEAKSKAKKLKTFCWLDHAQRDVSRQVNSWDLRKVSSKAMSFQGGINYIIFNQ